MRWFVVLVCLVLSAGCEASARDSPLSEADTQATIQTMSALELMAAAFEGEPGEREIERLLLPVMECCRLADTEANRHRAGSALVALGNEYNLAEMDILREMRAICDAGLRLSFPDAAGLAAANLVSDR